MSWDKPVFPKDAKNSIEFFFNFWGVSLDFWVKVLRKTFKLESFQKGV